MGLWESGKEINNIYISCMLVSSIYVFACVNKTERDSVRDVALVLGVSVPAMPKRGGARFRRRDITTPPMSIPTNSIARLPVGRRPGVTI